MKAIYWVLSSIGVIIVIGLIGLLSCFSHVDNYEGAYMFDSRTGQTNALISLDKEGVVIPKQGYIFSYPIIQSVHTIDLRPMQLCIRANFGTFQRVNNCKLVQFDFNGYRKFISWHGRSSYGTETLEKILMAYAYDEHDKGEYTFMKILEDHGDLKPITIDTTSIDKLKTTE